MTARSVGKGDAPPVLVRSAAVAASSDILCGACGERVSPDVHTCPACGGDPRLVGRYRVEAIVGRGAAGTTYRATDLRDGARVAIKEMSIGGAGDELRRDKLEREARVLRQLEHPRIPRYVDHFVAGVGKHRALYLVQEFIEGETLLDEMERRRYSEDEVLEVVGELLDVFTYLHGLRPPVVHRDVKTRNVMRRKADRRLVLVDFGSVRDVLRDPALGGSTIAGTFGYMAPEQFRGEATPATDVYGVAVLAVVLLSRRAPEDMIGPRHDLEWRPWVQVRPPVAKMLERWLDADPRRRPADAVAARADLERTRELLRTPPPQPAPSAVVAAPPTDLELAPPRNRYVAMVLAFSLGVFGAHHFYLGNRVAGFFSALFCWTLIPMVLNFIHGIQLLGMTSEEFHRKYNPTLYALRHTDTEGFARQLAALHQLHQSGALTDEEYAYEKQRLLAIRDELLPAPRGRKKRRKRR
jgi:TM2 domain-containing membrane protein YozV